LPRHARRVTPHPQVLQLLVIHPHIQRLAVVTAPAAMGHKDSFATTSRREKVAIRDDAVFDSRRATLAIWRSKPLQGKKSVIGGTTGNQRRGGAVGWCA